jgi:glycosyltransferase involved in cell wall biosynthesis
MRVAFHAPLKHPDHPVPSGDRRMARLLISAIEAGGHHVEVASELRSFDGSGRAEAQTRIRDAAVAESQRLIEHYRGRPTVERPSIWFTYHVYYKAPDWLGPAVSAALDIPYVTAEASYAPKRAGGSWSLNHEQTRVALQAAAVHFCVTRFDWTGLEALLGGRDRLIYLPPFLDEVPAMEGQARAGYREQLCSVARFDPTIPVLVCVAMMRPGDKETSYRMLAAALAGIADLDWNLVLVGDGAARPAVEKAFAAVCPERLHWAGELGPEEVGRHLAAADIYVWPAHNEAYGMAFLEAQARGLPVVAQATRGVPDVVAVGRSAVLTPEGDLAAFGQAIRGLIVDRTRRAAMGAAARAFVAGERTIERAAAILDGGLTRAVGR